MAGKRYYLTMKNYRNIGWLSEVWHCSSERVSELFYDFIIPLERKPRNVEIREGN